MLDKKTYHQTKKNLRCLCRDNLIKLCEEVKLNDYEKDLLLYFYEKKTVVDICMKLHICSDTYTKDMKMIIAKIIDYNKNIR